MPTGYTAYIEDGNITTGKEFLKLCLREFGIAVDMRNEPLSVPVPAHFEPDEWYKNHYMNMVKKLKENESLTFEEVKLRRQREHDKEVKSARRAIAQMTEVNERYKQIRKQIEAWTPPTEDYNGIKQFAIDQIEKSMNTEDQFDYYQKIIDKPFDDSDEAVREYMVRYLADLQNAAERSKRNYEKAMARANEKTEFMKVFLESLSAMDAVEERRGRWIMHDDFLGLTCECSECHIETCGDSPYCPNCGARMDKEERL